MRFLYAMLQLTLKLSMASAIIFLWMCSFVVLWVQLKTRFRKRLEGVFICIFRETKSVVAAAATRGRIWIRCKTWHRECLREKTCRHSACSRSIPQPCLDPPKSEWHDGQRQKNEPGKCIRENTALRTKFRGDVRVQACHAAVRIEFAFGRLGVITTQASWLVQVGDGVLIGLRACWLMT